MGSRPNKIYDSSAVIIFIKEPGKGQVKSRLARALGKELAKEAYIHFTLDILRTIRKYPLRIFFYPPDSRIALMRWLGKDFVCIPQKGRGLGKRMENAFVRSFSDGLEKALIVGSDIPDLAPEVIDEAFEALDKSDAVIGPATDGGYYLIGFNKTSFLPVIFRGIKWGSGSVFRETMDIFRNFGSRVHILPEWQDVDTLKDLRSLVMRNRATDFRNSDTMSWATRNKDKIFGNGA